MKKLRFVITGNPGVGKHTSAGIIAEMINAEIVDINDVAIKNNAISEVSDLGLDVNVRKLARVLERLTNTKRDLVIVGHLAPYVLKPVGINIVAVLRRSPYDLEKTLKRRGYNADKVRENVESEIIGTLLYDSLKTFGKRKVAEFDTTSKTPKETAEEILSTLQKKPKPKSMLSGIDWLKVVSENGDMGRFFKY
ncbi:MAG: AAA family ATPase [Thermoproteota archaeon]|nr:AAA family ATPase [Thermoproteota archaeon]